MVRCEGGSRKVKGTQFNLVERISEILWQSLPCTEPILTKQKWNLITRPRNLRTLGILSVFEWVRNSVVPEGDLCSLRISFFRWKDWQKINGTIAWAAPWPPCKVPHFYFSSILRRSLHSARYNGCFEIYYFQLPNYQSLGQPRLEEKISSISLYLLANRSLLGLCAEINYRKRWLEGYPKKKETDLRNPWKRSPFSLHSERLRRAHQLLS